MIALPSDDSSLPTSNPTPGAQDNTQDGEEVATVDSRITPAEEGTVPPAASTVSHSVFDENLNASRGFTPEDLDPPTGSGMLPYPAKEEGLTSPTASGTEPEGTHPAPGSGEEHETTEPEKDEDRTQGGTKTITDL